MRTKAWMGSGRAVTLMVGLMLPWSVAWSQAPANVQPQASSWWANSGLEISAILDGSYASDVLALGTRPKDFGLGHNELSIAGHVDNLFSGRITGVAHSDDSSVEFELEEAFVETTALPAGFQIRGGRFLAAVGYLNEQHMHADDFVERPLLYRAFLGSHYFDDGVRFQWVAPTSLYWRTTVEAFNGTQLVQDPVRKRTPGVYTFGSRIGGDVGVEHSWQVGVSYLYNRLEPSAEEDGHEHDEEEHDHAHGSLFSGRNMYVIDGVWKWAPDGNNAERQLRLSAEYARVTDLNEYATSGDYDEAWYVAGVYKFAPQWEVGLRYDELRVLEPHGDHFHSGRLREYTAVLTWKPSHYSLVRLQWSSQRSRGGFEDATDAVFLQYVMSLGAHGAHAF